MKMTDSQTAELEDKLDACVEKIKDIEMDITDTDSIKCFYGVVLEVVLDILEEVNEYEKTLIFDKIKKELNL